MYPFLFLFIALGLLVLALVAHHKWYNDEVASVATLFCILMFMIGVVTMFTHSTRQTYIVVPKSQMQIMTTESKVIVAYREFSTQYTTIDDLYAIQHADSFKIYKNYNIFGMHTDNEIVTYFTHDTTKGVKQ